MLTTTICRRWLFLLVTGSAIGVILAVPNTTDSAKAVLNNGLPDPPGDKEVPGVEPLPTTTSISDLSKDDFRPTTIGDDVFDRSSIPPNENKKLSTIGKMKYDGKQAKSLPEIVKSDSSIEPIPLVPLKKSSNDSQATSERESYSGIGSNTNLENRTEHVETGARSLNGNDLPVMVDEKMETRNSLHANITDLSDVSMDEDYKDFEGGEYLASGNTSGINKPNPPPLLSIVFEEKVNCTYGNESYTPGAVVTKDCEDRCICSDDGRLVNCQPLCVTPFVRAGRGIQDPFCQEQLLPENPCCATIICAQDSEPEPEETCYLGNKTVARGETLEDGCSRVCLCEAQGMLKCRPRCPQSNSTTSSMAASTANQRDKCVPVRDPKDPCCTITLCDVTLGDLDQFKPESLPVEARANLTKVEVLNATAIKLGFSSNGTPEHATIELSTDKVLWRVHKLKKDGIVGNLEPSRTYYVRVGDEAGLTPGPSMQVVLPAEPTPVTTVVPMMGNSRNETPSTQVKVQDGNDSELCHHRGKSYKVGAEWYDECISFCTCSMSGDKPKTECATIECPTDFGLDVLNPECLDWEWVPEDFVPNPPHCCSQEVRCRNNGSCLYEGKSYDNWSEIPSNVTGCEKRCYCELGKVSCLPVCPPVQALPPSTLQCPPSHASLMHLPQDECCLHWVCGDPSKATLPTTFGRNGTSPFPGPLATDSINQLQSIDDKKKPVIGGSGNLQQWTVTKGSTDHYATVPPRKYHESSDLDSSNHPDVTDDYGQIHYPMDPGYPTTTTIVPPAIPYQGPYNPNFRPTQPSVEDVFRLTPWIHDKTNIFQTPKDKQKSKTESKKPVEPAKPTKETSATVVEETQFTPAIIAEKQLNTSHLAPTLIKNKIPNPLAPLGNTGVQYAVEKPPGPISYQKNYSTSLSQPPENAYKIFPPHYNGDSIVPQFQFHHELDGPPPGPVRYGGKAPDAAVALERPNTILPGDRQNNNIGTRDPAIIFNRGHDRNPHRPPQPPAQVYLANSKPNQPPQASGEDSNDHDLPEELYHLINIQHPGLLRLNQSPREGHQGLYGTVQPNQGANGNEGIGQIDGLQHPGSLQYFNPHIFSETGENYGGGTGGYQFHHHGPQLPGGARQQIEELLLRVGEKDPNPGPFQRYPGGQEPISRKPSVVNPPRITIPQATQNPGLPTHLNHPFAGTTLINNMHSLSDHGLPPGFPIHGGPGVQPSSDQVTVQTLEAISENRVRLVFTVPHVLVGLHGRVEVRYTSEESNVDPATWKSQIFAPPEDLIATPQLEFELGDLMPSTEYKVMVTVTLRDLSNSPTSKIYKVVTLEAPNTDVVTLPPQIPTDAELTVAEVNSTWANLVWKQFTDYELQFIDGVQLRYKETEGMVYAATPLIHRAVTSYIIENLKPAVTYEVGIYFIPFPGQTTELISEKPLNFTTSAEPDPYSFDIKVEIKGIKSTEVEVAWQGVPYPEDKYVNIYRAIYQSDTGKEDTSTFKIAKRDSPARTLIGDLKPGTRYRLWIEVYLTNGRIKKSNVQDFVTKPGGLATAGVLQQGKLAAQVPLHEGDYYGPLVIVAIVASIAILSTLILLMMLMKRRSSSKADISPRKTTAAYDNPSYKTCENPTTVTNYCDEEKMGSIINPSNNEHRLKEPA